MESVAAVEPLHGAALGSEPATRSDTRIKALYDSRPQSQYVVASATGHGAVADHLVQLRAPAGCCVHTPQCAWAGNGCSRRGRRFLRYRSTVGLAWLL